MEIDHGDGAGWRLNPRLTFHASPCNKENGRFLDDVSKEVALRRDEGDSCS